MPQGWGGFRSPGIGLEMSKCIGGTGGGCTAPSHPVPLHPTLFLPSIHPSIPRPPVSPSLPPGAAPSAPRIDVRNRKPTEDEEHELSEKAEVGVPWGIPGEGRGGGGGGRVWGSFALVSTSPIKCKQRASSGGTMKHSPPARAGSVAIWTQPRPTSTSENFLTSCGIRIKS